MKRTWLTSGVILLSFVSLLNDASSELLYPVLPMYFKSIGFGALWIGIMEGIAEAVAGLSKGWFGRWSDMRGQRVPFVRFGYFLSALAKPLIVLFPNVLWALGMRVTDKIGKGVRTGARDALLAQQSDAKHRGKVFGFHRAFDTVGAFIGPSIALWYLLTHDSDDLTNLFYIALIPGIATLTVLFFLKEEKLKGTSPGKLPTLRQSFSYWSESPKEFRRVVGGIILFALFNSSDLFLLMALYEIHEPLENCYFGYCFTPEQMTVLYYILFNFAFAALAYPAGYFSDKFNPKNIFIVGLVLFVSAYAGFAYMMLPNAHEVNPALPIFLMIIYGAFAALNDGIGKAWISVLIPKHEKASAMGFFAGANSLALLFASTIAGIIWSQGSPWMVFALTAVLVFVVIFYLILFTNKPRMEET